MSRGDVRLEAARSVAARPPSSARQAGDTLTVSPEKAAAMLGIARSTFYASVLGELRVVRLGRRRLVPVAELERWIQQNAERPGSIR